MSKNALISVDVIEDTLDGVAVLIEEVQDNQRVANVTRLANGTYKVNVDTLLDPDDYLPFGTSGGTLNSVRGYDFNAKTFAKKSATVEETISLVVKNPDGSVVS